MRMRRPWRLPAGMINCHTMAKAKIAITVDSRLLGEVDRLVRERHFTNRSQAVEAAVQELLGRLRRKRLVEESAKLDAGEERRLADEGLSAWAGEWPEY